VPRGKKPAEKKRVNGFRELRILLAKGPMAGSGSMAQISARIEKKWLNAT
jgi:hypothetical protein